MKTIFSLILFVLMSTALAGSEAGKINEVGFKCAHANNIESNMLMGVHTHADCTQSSAIDHVETLSKIMTPKIVTSFAMIDLSYVSITLKVSTPPPII
jgi:hypothetical protein